MAWNLRNSLTDALGKKILDYFDPILDRYVAVHGRGGGIQIISTNVHYVDSITPLGAGASFVGTARNLGATPRCSQITARAFADQAGTMFIEQSRDGLEANYRCPEEHRIAVTAGTSRQLTVNAVASFWRVRYLNGGTAQAAFELLSAEVGV